MSVYEVSEQARIEVMQASHPVDAPTSGRVLATHLALDSQVKEGDVLVELDASIERERLAEASAKRAALFPQVAATRRQAAAEAAALDAFRGQLSSTLAEARSHLEEGQIRTKEGRDDAERARRMFAASVAPESEVAHARAEAERRQAAQEALEATVRRLSEESTTGARDREVKVASLERDAVLLDGEANVLSTTIEALESDIRRRTIRAPADGRLGEIGNLRVGAVLGQGEHIATIISGGELRVVASFPSVALGRIRAGQRAHVRLDGFAWTEYGALDAEVTKVASELRDGRARVELGIREGRDTRIPMQHGLVGLVEVIVEESTPSTLILRAAGRVGNPTSSGPAQSNP